MFAISPLPELADIADHWGRGSIRTLAGMGIVSGFPDGRFNPNAAVTRAEFVSMLMRALGLEAKPEAAAMLHRLVAER
ncbi:MAG: Cellulosome-anchoring protein [Syntrophomonadaceae bacterium]|nr:Cellulosome-anchoring protein [Bacillota bacterium]